MPSYKAQAMFVAIAHVPFTHDSATPPLHAP